MCHLGLETAVNKAGFKKRVERLLKTQRPQQVAANCAKGLRKVCQEAAESTERGLPN